MKTIEAIRLRHALVALVLVGAAPLAVMDAIEATRSAHADDAELDMANARKLFNQGLDARKAGDDKRALEMFEAADALFATPRGRLELGRQRMSMGLLVEAYATLLSVANVKVTAKDEAKYAPYRAEAAQLATALEKRIPTMTITLANVPTGGVATVRVDQALVPLAALIEPRMVNPGKHVVTGALEGLPGEKSVAVELKEGESQQVTLTFDAAVAPPIASASSVPTTVASSAPPPPPPPPPAREPPSSWSTQKTLAVVAGGVGIVGLAFGAGFGLAASSKANDAKPACGGVNSSTTCSTPEGASLRHDAIKLAGYSTAGFVVGAALVGVGAVLWIAAPSHAAEGSATAGLVVGPGSLSLQGAF